MERQLINYLPEFLRDFREIKILMEQEQMLAETIWTDLDAIWKNQYLDELTEEGCRRWEALLGYKPKDTYTLEERRKILQAKIFKDKGGSVTQLLDGLCGKDGYYVTVKANTMTVKISLRNKNMRNAVIEALELTKPAGMILLAGIMYNTWEMLRNKRWKDLKKYTWKQLKEDTEIGGE